LQPGGAYPPALRLTASDAFAELFRTALLARKMMERFTLRLMEGEWQTQQRRLEIMTKYDAGQRNEEESPRM
jgi:hypothetical protein